ncbi:MAG: hypothetical protein NC218_08160 [Acetobacter sp.]|nr:hypothetical protein [Acetobacter sp.]
MGVFLIMLILMALAICGTPVAYGFVRFSLENKSLPEEITIGFGFKDKEGIE